MKRNLKAVFEHGVLKPLEPLDLPERQQVNLTLVEDDSTADTGQPAETCYAVAERLGLIGMLEGLPSDLSTNRKYFDGMGK